MSHIETQLKELSEHFLKGEFKNDESFVLHLITALAGDVTVTHNQLIALALKLKQM